MALGAETLDADNYRAITLTKGERRVFRVPGLERVTGNTGRCIEEGLASGEAESLYLEALCGGLRTTVAWQSDGRRVQVMVCAEEGGEPPGLLSLRRSIQVEVRALKGVTACVRNGRVELWGWVKSEADLKHVVALERKYPDRVRSFVEMLEP